jgi:hypothetical protein
MIYVHSVRRAVRYYPERPALRVNGVTFDFSRA